MGKDAPSDHTFHHIENTNEVVLIPSDLHSFVRHTGGNATGKNESILKFIDKIENEIGIIPKDYKEFLLKHNGGLPNNDFDLFYNRKKAYSVSLYYGLYNANKYDYASIKNRLSFLIFPEKTIPVATDGGGNDYLLFIDNGAIYFWNHENSDGFNKNLKNLKKVANSFSELIEKIEKSSPIDRDIKITETETDFIIE